MIFQISHDASATRPKERVEGSEAFLPRDGLQAYSLLHGKLCVARLLREWQPF